MSWIHLFTLLFIYLNNKRQTAINKTNIIITIDNNNKNRE